MAKDFIATIKEPELAAWFKSILGKTDLPIISPFPVCTFFPGLPRRKVFMLDLDLLDKEEKQRLITASARRYKVPGFIFEADIKRFGFPILAEHCSLRIDNPQRWL